MCGAYRSLAYCAQTATAMVHVQVHAVSQTQDIHVQDIQVPHVLHVLHVLLHGMTMSLHMRLVPNYVE